MTYERNFKGVWIPKEIWLNEKLTVMEKLFLVEIDSLDNDKGCFASNGHFSDFFGISKGRCTQIIKSLESKGLIKITLEYKGYQIVKRTIKVVNKLNTLVNKLNTPIKDTKYPYLENDEGNNTLINNTSNNTSNIKPSKSDALDSEFSDWWNLYDKKIDRKKAMQKFKQCRKKHNLDEIMTGTRAYLKTITDKKYQKHPTTFLNGESYLDIEGYQQDVKYDDKDLSEEELSEIERRLGF